MSEQNLAKLPKWAQDRITVAELNLQAAENKIAQLTGTQETNTYMVDMMEHRPLLDNVMIRFVLSKHSWVDVRKLRDDERILVMGSSSVDLHPESSNYLTVGVLPR